MKSIFLLLLVVSCGSLNSQGITASFKMADTICANSPFTSQNTTAGPVLTHYWEICPSTAGSVSLTPDILPTALASFSNPSRFNVQKDGGSYYMFVTNKATATITRFSFGNSLLNSPTATNIGNPSNAITQNPEGIYLEKENGTWYGIVVGGTNPGEIVRLNFGNSLLNSPTAVNLGNIGGLNYPCQITVFKAGTKIRALVLNRQGNSLSRIDFGSSFTNTPTGTNYGNVGGFDQPSSMAVIYQNNFWRAIVCNEGNNSLSRLNFGDSLQNLPTGAMYTLPGAPLNSPSAINLSAVCDSVTGYVCNRGDNKMIALSFPSGLQGSVVMTVLNTSSLSSPASIERYREGSTSLFFVANGTGQNIVRMTASGSTPLWWAATQNMQGGPVSPAGTYLLRLYENEGLYNNASICKSVVVTESGLSAQSHYTLCKGEQVTLSASGATGYTWTSSTGTVSTASTITASPASNTNYTLNYIAGCLGSKIISVTVNSCNGLSNNSIGRISVFPNPAVTEVYFALPGDDSDIEVKIYNALGSPVITNKTLNSQHPMDISSLPKGLYYYEVTTATREYVGKVMKE